MLWTRSLGVWMWAVCACVLEITKPHVRYLYYPRCFFLPLCWLAEWIILHITHRGLVRAHGTHTTPCWYYLAQFALLKRMAGCNFHYKDALSEITAAVFVGAALRCKEWAAAIYFVAKVDLPRINLAAKKIWGVNNIILPWLSFSCDVKFKVIFKISKSVRCNC